MWYVASNNGARGGGEGVPSKFIIRFSRSVNSLKSTCKILSTPASFGDGEEGLYMLQEFWGSLQKG